MKKTLTQFSWTTAALLAMLGSCTSASTNPELEGRDRAWAGESMRNASLNNAIISQHTLYPYHFTGGSARLNDLGERDLHVLADHFKEAQPGTPGELNVRRGTASPSLYEARIKFVLESLAAHGVEGGMVAVTEGLPGGDGMASERVIVILKDRMEKQSPSGGGASGAGAGLLQ
ncbi:MAG: hypothetical protein ACKVXR_11115 [Planctomycetota bacterium]